MQTDRLKKALAFLKEKGVEASSSYQKIANKMGYNPNYVSDLVNGRFVISEKFADRFQQEFHINKKWLLSGEGDMIAPAQVYSRNENGAMIASDINSTGRYLKGEEINMKLIREYNSIIMTLQSHIANLTETNIELNQQLQNLKKKD